MTEGQIARLPIQPDNPWYEFAKNFDNLPFKLKSGVSQKSILANSFLISKGLEITATNDGETIILRVIFSDTFKFLVGSELVNLCRNVGWTYHTKAPDNLLFRLDFKTEGNDTKTGAKFIPILKIFQVDPYQDWGV